jgi:hypothetical protein
MKRFHVLALCIVITAMLAGCREEGPAEKAGREVDEAVDELKHGSEGAMEKAGRKLDEAADEVEDEIDDAKRELNDD